MIPPHLSTDPSATGLPRPSRTPPCNLTLLPGLLALLLAACGEPAASPVEPSPAPAPSAPATAEPATAEAPESALSLPAPRLDPVLHEHRRLDDVFARRSSLLVEEPGFDPNRDAEDLPQDSAVDHAIDPLAFLVGPVRVTYDGDPADSFAADLTDHIDHDQGIVRSNTGEIILDHQRGVLTVDAPKAQAAAGFLNRTDPIRLADVQITSGNDYAAVQVVSLDTLDLAESRHVLVQAATVARPHGFEEKPAQWSRDNRGFEGFEITNLGSSPWNLPHNNIDLMIANPHLDTAHALDANGRPVRKLDLTRDSDTGHLQLRFPPDALHVILTGD